MSPGTLGNFNRGSTVNRPVKITDKPTLVGIVQLCCFHVFSLGYLNGIADPTRPRYTIRMKNKQKTYLLALAGSLVLSSMNGVEAAEEAKPLEASVAAGATLNDGNTESSMYTVSLKLKYKTCERSELRFDSSVAYGETNDEKSADNADAALEFKYLLSERAYAVLNTSVARDDIADVEYRWISSVGIGYFLMKSDAATMTLDLGPALRVEKKGGVRTEDGALRLFERYERTMESKAKFWQTLEYLPNIDDFEIYILKAELGVEAPVSAKLSIRLVVNNTYDSDPAEGSERNDVTVTGALSYLLF